MSEYQRLYRRAEVRERWANIYGGSASLAAWMRLWAAEDRLRAEVIKAAKIEEAAAWVARVLQRIATRGVSRLR